MAGAGARATVSKQARLREGHWADVVVFDPVRVIDRATFDRPHQYPLGIDDVIVNGVVVIREGEHTGATPGRAVYGPGQTGS